MHITFKGRLKYSKESTRNNVIAKRIPDCRTSTTKSMAGSTKWVLVVGLCSKASFFSDVQTKQDHAQLSLHVAVYSKQHIWHAIQ